MRPASLPPSKYAMDGDGKYWGKTFVVVYSIRGMLTTLPLTREFTAYDESHATEQFNDTKSENERFVSVYEIK